MAFTRKKREKIIDWMVMVAIVVMFVIAIPVAVGCILVFVGEQFLGLFTMSRWVAIAVWLVYSLLTIWVGFYDPSSGEVDRPKRVREVFAWVIFWPIISMLQGLVLFV